MADASSPYLTLDQLAAVVAPGRDPSQREQIIDSANLVTSPYAVKNWLNYGMGSSSGYKGDTTPLYEGHQYTLVDNKTGEVLARGSTPEEIQKIQSIVSDTLASQGRQADWRLYDATPQAGLTNMHERMPGAYLNVSTPGDPRGVVVAGNTPDASLLENIGKAAGTVLPMAISFIPGFGQLAAGLQVAAGAGAGGVGAALRGDNILNGALMGGLSSAGGQYLGPQLQGIAPGLTKAAANAIGTGLGATTGGLLTGQSIGNSILGGVASGGLSYLGGEVQNALKSPTSGSGVSSGGGAGNAPPGDILVTAGRAPVSINAPVTGQNTKAPADPNEILVTGTRTPTPSITSPFAVNTDVQKLIDDYAATRTDNTDIVDDINVTGTRTPTPSITSPFAVNTDVQKLIDDYAVKEPEPTEPEAAKDEIIVTGTRTPTPSISSPFHLDPLPPEIDKAADNTPEDKKKKWEKYLKLAALGLSLVPGGKGGGSGGSGTVSGGLGQLRSPVFDQKLSVLTPEQNRAKYGARNMTGTDWATWGSRPATSFFQNVDEQPKAMAHGGSFAAKRGGSKPRTQFAVNGPGTGRSDDIPAVLSDGEYVMDAETVALLGDGSSKAGAKKLDDLRVKIRKHKGKKLAQGRFSANAKSPEAYLSGGRT